MASTKKEAKQIAEKGYGSQIEYVKPYRYASKGNNFYEFLLHEWHLQKLSEGPKVHPKMKKYLEQLGM